MAALASDDSFQLFVEASRFALVAVFLLAGAKLARRSEFELAVMNYQLLPDSAARLVGRWLPIGGEIAAAVLLAVGVAIVPVTAFLALLLASFIVAVAVNLLRGKAMDCGCFAASGTPRQITWWVVGRNLLLLGLALLIVVSPPAALAVWPGWGTPSPSAITTKEAAAMLFASSTAVLTAFIANEVWRVQGVANSLQAARQ